MGCKFSPDAVIDWKKFYFVCTKKVFERNMVKNHSGEKGFKYWNVFHNDIFYGGWDRFGGSDDADNDVFGGIDNYGNHNDDGDSEEEYDSDYGNGDGSGTHNDDKSVEDDDIDIIFEGGDSHDDDDCNEDFDSDYGDEDDSDETGSVVVSESSVKNDDENTNDNEDDNGNENGNEIVNENENDSDSSDDEVGYGNSCRGWIVECPPVGAPLLPERPEFEGKQHCFVTTYYDCSKEHVIDLIKAGFTTDILDQLQPPIEVCSFL